MNLEIAYLPTTSLKPNPSNPRVHTAKHVSQIAQSIEAFGFNVPILVDEQKNVVAGHGRLLAAQKLGWSSVPVIKLNHLTEPQYKAFLIADKIGTYEHSIPKAALLPPGNSSWDTSSTSKIPGTGISALPKETVGGSRMAYRIFPVI